MRYKIFKDGEVVNTIVADERFAKDYCCKHGFTYEEEFVPEPERKATTEERVTDLEQATSALEDAMCEMDAANEERMAAIEDALCEMDMG